MLSMLKNIWQDIRQGENIDLYLTVLIAISLAVLNLFGVAQSLVTPVTMAVLAVLAISALVSRHKLEIIIGQLRQPTNDILLEQFPPTLDDDLKNSKELWLIGVVLTRTIATYYSMLQEKLKKGDNVRVLVVNPYGAANTIVGNRTYRSMSAQESTKWIELSLVNICALKEVAPTKMEIRIIDYPLSFGFLAVDLTSPDGVIYAEHYTFKMGEDKPLLVLRRQDGRWYDFFKRQILTLWENAVEWNCQSTSQKQI